MFLPAMELLRSRLIRCFELALQTSYSARSAPVQTKEQTGYGCAGHKKRRGQLAGSKTPVATLDRLWEKFLQLRKKNLIRLGIYLFTVAGMSNLCAVVDTFHHPEIPYFDEEHLIVGGITGLVTAIIAQTVAVDHWETAIYADDNWKFVTATTPPEADWRKLSFDDSNWSEGPGGIGYGDGDDQTIVAQTVAVFMRREFDVPDTAKIADAILSVDYDDAFVAYLNGVEVARAGISGSPPAFDQLADSQHEAEVPQGGRPRSFRLGAGLLRENLHQGENVLAVEAHNASLTSSDLSATAFLSFGIIDSSSFFGEPPDWFSAPQDFMSSNLPIVVITAENGATIVDEPKVAAHMGVVYNGRNVRNNIADGFKHYDGFIGIELRGNASQSFPKKPYLLETRDERGDNRNVSLFGMPKENDWVLRAAYVDKTLMRDVIAYHLALSMGNWASRTQHCELVLNGEYQGVYVFCERLKPDKNRVNIVQMDTSDVSGDAVTGGYIYEVAQGGTDFGERRRFKYPKGDEITPAQAAYIKQYDDDFRNVMAGSMYDDPVQGYSAWIDVDSFIDEILVQETTKNSDAYGWSSYFHKDRLGKLKAGPPWDFDQAMSNSTFNDGPNYSEWIIEKSEIDPWLLQNYPAFWIRLFREPDFRQRLAERWRQLRNGPWHTDSLLQFIDNTALQLEEAQERNFQRWPILGTAVWRTPPGVEQRDTYQDEVDYLKTFLTNRLSWMDSNIATVSKDTTSGSQIEHFTLEQNYPNPFNQATSIRLNLPDDSQIKLSVYNIAGRTVDVLFSGDMNAGEHTLYWDAGDAASGIYFFRVRGDFSATRKGLLLK